MRLGFVGPLPSPKSAIGDYDEFLLSALSRDNDLYIDAYIQQNKVNIINGINFIKLPFLFNYSTIIKNQKLPDIFQLQFGNSYFNSYVLRFLNIIKSRGMPIVSTLHDFTVKGIVKEYRAITSDPKTIFYDINAPSVRQIIDQSDKVIVHSYFSKNEFINKYSCDPKKIEVIFQGVDVDKFNTSLTRNEARKKLSMDEKDFILVSFSFITPRKGFEEVIKAIKLLKDSGMQCRYFMIGGFNYLHYKLKLKYLIKKLDLENTVHFLGYVPIDEITIYLRAANMLIQPRKRSTEGASASLVMTLASGTPVLTNKIGGFSEYVVDENTGFFTDHIAESYRDRVIELCERPSLLDKVGKNAIGWCQQNIDWKIIAKKHSGLWRELLEGEK